MTTNNRAIAEAVGPDYDPDATYHVVGNPQAQALDPERYKRVGSIANRGSFGVFLDGGEAPDPPPKAAAPKAAPKPPPKREPVKPFSKSADAAKKSTK
jgi:hypothetical protein